MIGNTKGLPAVVLLVAWQPLVCVEHLHVERVSCPHVCQGSANAAASILCCNCPCLFCVSLVHVCVAPAAAVDQHAYTGLNLIDTNTGLNLID